jgi:lipoprotein-anchoring transpeptidase ErfK/SrfK
MRYVIATILLLTAMNTMASDLMSVVKRFYTADYEEPIKNTTFPETRPASKANVFIFDPQHFVWAVYNKNGRRVGFGKASGGGDYCKDINKPCRTVEGEFTVFRKEDADCTSKTFPIDEGGGAPMPHCMFFYKGYAIHGSNHVTSTNKSHGCIRVTPKAAEWINTNYIDPGSLVIVLPYDDKLAA